MEEKVKKTDWGYELIWASHPTYMGKILVFEGLNARTDMYLHKTKNKSLFVKCFKDSQSIAFMGLKIHFLDQIQ